MGGTTGLAQRGVRAGKVIGGRLIGGGGDEQALAGERAQVNRTSPPPVVPVLIVGAGPTGTAAALLLARLGVPSMVVDTTSPCPLDKLAYISGAVVLVTGFRAGRRRNSRAPFRAVLLVAALAVALLVAAGAALVPVSSNGAMRQNQVGRWTAASRVATWDPFRLPLANRASRERW